MSVWKDQISWLDVDEDGHEDEYPTEIESWVTEDGELILNVSGGGEHDDFVMHGTMHGTKLTAERLAALRGLLDAAEAAHAEAAKGCEMEGVDDEPK